MENCWQVLLARLNRYRVEPSEAMRAAEALWNGLYWPGETLMRRAVTSMRRVHILLPDHQLVTRYLELIPREKAIALEDPLRRPSMGWTYYEGVMAACKELFSIERAYQGAGGGGIPHARQRAAWANETRMAQTPLGLLAPPKSQQQSGGKGGGKGEGDGECKICQCNVHKGAQCPDHKAKKECVFLSKPDPSRKRGCNVCRGIGHWKHHHEQDGGTQQRQVKEGGGGKEPCKNWETFGRCLRPPNKPCQLLHDPAKKGPTNECKEKMERMSNSACNLWAKGNCFRGKNCYFKHDPAKKGTYYVPGGKPLRPMRTEQAGPRVTLSRQLPPFLRRGRVRERSTYRTQRRRRRPWPTSEISDLRSLRSVPADVSTCPVPAAKCRAGRSHRTRSMTSARANRVCL